MNTIQNYKQELLNNLYHSYNHTKECPLNCQGKNNPVFGEGNPDANLLFIGEAPGREEDRLGRPFVGRSGKLLNIIFNIIGIQRSIVFITNIVKCRPPNNRKPTEQEIHTSKNLLINQIKIIRPHAICTLGASAIEGLMGQSVKISQTRGTKRFFQHIPVIPAYHPAYVLRNPIALSTLVEDIKQAYCISQIE